MFRFLLCSFLIAVATYVVGYVIGWGIGSMIPLGV